MKVISLIGQKGGTGKTTLAQILAVSSVRAGHTTIGIDLDPQTSLCTWGDLREDEDPAIFDTQHSRLSKTLDAAREQGVDVAIIDTAGRAEQAAMAAANASDLVILPLQPTTADLTTVEASQSIIQLAKTPAFFAVLMRVKPQGTRHLETKAFLESKGIPVCPHMIGDRVIYQDAGGLGQVPVEFDPGGKAALESKEVYKYTFSKVGKKG